MAQHLISCTGCGGLSPDLAPACLHCDATLARPGRWARLFQLLAGGGFMMTLAACYGAPYRDRMMHAGDQDRDFDGALIPADCADDDATRFPGAADADGDGIDQNCDGVDGWRDPAVIAAPIDPAPAPSHIAAPAPTP
jgi:hypothetical protein